MSRMNTVYLETGSNTGNREENLRNAILLLKKRAGKVSNASHIYESQPWGNEHQPEFINQALELQTELSPHALMETIQSIEKKIGRDREHEERWGPRVIDIDILLYENLVLKDKDLVIPHPELPNRNFALVPLMEIAAEVIHPVLKLPIEEIYFNCADPLDVYILD